ncbi:MAG: OmpA family protein [Alphaproteobacteria bacterium]|nr:OmpA family protein [Alphaproteobacteria bacterium]MBU6471720.1 OmpA family protein [Alphaproteobacteria bacterium]MDE2014121.1 OmpA family protein [Alphaproteobacteria bacterium]MDE2074739.1 OmpA family protein [Alphaproteobacteria bacterium]MDE2352020.1 OmpA family protein [Alphaproteobacteria bacterium]
MNKIALLMVAAGLMLTGCQTPRPYYPSEQHPETGATAGANPLPRPHGAVAVHRAAPSGPVGVLADNMVGPYMDGQEMDLRRNLRAVRVARIGNDIVLNLRSDILFRAGSRAISPAAATTIEAVAGVLRRYDRTLIEVNGYTDTTGSADLNLKLSQARAEAVANELVDAGINPARISPRGYGETHLRIPTGDNVNEPRNRRVEIRILPHVAAQG